MFKKLLVLLLFVPNICFADKFGNQNQQFILANQLEQFNMKSLTVASQIVNKYVSDLECNELDWKADHKGLVKHSISTSFLPKFCYTMLIKWDGTLTIQNNNDKIIFNQPYSTWINFKK